MSVLVICEVLGDFVNTMTSDDKYSVRNSKILPQPIQMQLPKKQITLSQFFALFLKSTMVFEYLKKKNHDRHSLYILEIPEYERRG